MYLDGRLERSKLVEDRLVEFLHDGDLQAWGSELACGHKIMVQIEDTGWLLVEIE